MSRDPFLRLALLIASTGYLLGLVAAAHWLGLGGWVALVGVGGGVIAGVVTVEFERKPAPLDPHRRQRQPAEGTAGFERIG